MDPNHGDLIGLAEYQSLLQEACVRRECLTIARPVEMLCTSVHSPRLLTVRTGTLSVMDRLKFLLFHKRVS